MDLRQAPLFAHFSREQLVALGTCGARVRLPPGTRLVAANSAKREAWILLKGRARLHRDTPYGPFQLSTLGPGHLAGEASLIDPQWSVLDTTTDSDVDALCLDAAKLDAKLETDRALDIAFGWAVWKNLSYKLRDCNDKLTRFFSQSLTGKPAQPRPAAEPAAEFRIDIEAKRAVFREQRLSTMEINFLASLSRARRLRPNEVLFREGDPGDYLYVVVEGRIMISKEIPGAGEEAFAFLERGEILGEMALIDQVARCADAKADGDGAIVLAIPADVLSKVLNIEKVSSSRLLKVLCTLLARRLHDAHEKIVGWYILSGGATSRAVR